MDKNELLKAARAELARATTNVRQAWNLYTAAGGDESAVFPVALESINCAAAAVSVGRPVEHALSCLCDECRTARVA